MAWYRWMLSLKGFWWKRYWPNRGNIPVYVGRDWGIPRKYFSQDNLYFGRDSNRELREYLSTRLFDYSVLETELYVKACIKLTLEVRLWCMMPKQLFSNYSTCSTVLKPPLYKLLSGLSHRKLSSVSVRELFRPLSFCLSSTVSSVIFHLSLSL